MDFSSIFVSHDVMGVIAAIVGAASLVAAMGFAKWASKRVAGFFDGGSMADARSDRTIGGWYSHEQGMTGYESNYSAVGKSIGRHVRKGQR